MVFPDGGFGKHVGRWGGYKVGRLAGHRADSRMCRFASQQPTACSQSLSGPLVGLVSLSAATFWLGGHGAGPQVGWPRTWCRYIKGAVCRIHFRFHFHFHLRLHLHLQLQLQLHTRAPCPMNGLCFTSTALTYSPPRLPPRRRQGKHAPHSPSTPAQALPHMYSHT